MTSPQIDRRLNRAQILQALDALLGDLSGIAPDPDLFAPSTRIIESNRLSARGQGLWASASAIGDYRIVAADEAQQTGGFMGLIWRGDIASIVGIGLAFRNGRISDVEIIVGPERFPGATGVDARALGPVRSCFAQALPLDDRLSRDDYVMIATGYYDAVNRSDPGLARLAPDGARIEVGTQITSNPGFHFEFYKGFDGQDLPNFGEWTAREQFRRGLWNSDGVTDERYPIVDNMTGVVFAFTTYRPWHKRFETQVADVGRVGPIAQGRRVALNMLEAFKIEKAEISAMESVWEINDAAYLPLGATGA